MRVSTDILKGEVNQVSQFGSLDQKSAFLKYLSVIWQRSEKYSF